MHFQLGMHLKVAVYNRWTGLCGLDWWTGLVDSLSNFVEMGSDSQICNTVEVVIRAPLRLSIYSAKASAAAADSK